MPSKSLVTKKQATKPVSLGGQPPYVPTQEQHALVSKWAKQGVGLEKIACLLGICVKTVRKYFMDDVQVGRAHGVEQMTGKVFQTGIEGNVKCMLRYLEVMEQASWGQKQSIEITSDGSMSREEMQEAVLQGIKDKYKRGNSDD